MTQLQAIIEELKNINPDTDLGKAWKDQVEVNPVKVIHEIRYGLLHDYESVKNAISGRTLILVTDFDAMNEAEIKLNEIFSIWSKPRVERDYSAIRRINAEVELLFKIDELKPTSHE